MKNSLNIRTAVLATLAGVTILAFQNCAPTQFKEASDSVGMSLSVADDGSPQNEIIPPQEPQQPEVAVNDGEQREPSDDGIIAGPAATPAAEDEVVSEPKNNDGEVAKGPEQDMPKSEPQQPSQSDEQQPAPQVASDDGPKKPEQNQVHDQEQEENLVECDMGRANSKIILNSFLKASPSNSSATRVCMSENACLKIINEFAAKRDCSLSNSASAPSGKQCTDIFPGSRGTCKNAAKISDAQVADILKSMEQ